MGRIRQHGFLGREAQADDALFGSRLCGVVSAVVVGAGTAYAANKASKAANKGVDAQAGAASDANELSRERFEWDKDVYEKDTRPLQQADQALKQKVIDAQLAQAEKQSQFADEQNEYWEETYKPIEQQSAADAMGYDSAENVERRSGMAAANVNQQASNAAAQTSRLLSRFGLNPNSSAFAAQAGADSRAQALGAAGAATGAAFDTKDKAIALRAGTANFGRNMPNTASNYYAGSTASNGAASGASTGSLNNQMASTANMSNAYGNRIGGINAYGSAMASAYNQQANMWNNTASGLGGLAGGIVQDMGGWGAFGTAAKGMFSDRRLKTDIRRVGTTDDGLPIYTYRYKSGGPVQMGVMAQDAKKRAPEAVTADDDGMLMVDYSKVH